MLENMILSEKSPDTVVHVFDSICLKSKIGKSIKIGRFSRWLPAGWKNQVRRGREKWRMKIANGHRVSFLRLHKFSKMDCGDECITLNIVKKILYDE